RVVRNSGLRHDSMMSLFVMDSFSASQFAPRLLRAALRRRVAAVAAVVVPAVVAVVVSLVSAVVRAVVAAVIPAVVDGDVDVDDDVVATVHVLQHREGDSGDPGGGGRAGMPPGWPGGLLL